jgi:predicted RNase H-like HicB family nuclease
MECSPPADVRYCDHMAVADRIDTDIETLTIHYEDAEDGWVSAQIEEVPGAISQGRTREEARCNVISALRDLTEEPSWDERLLYRMRALLGR